MTNISTETGLPELPENHYWHVFEVPQTSDPKFNSFGGRIQISIFHSKKWVDSWRRERTLLDLILFRPGKEISVDRGFDQTEFVMMLPKEIRVTDLTPQLIRLNAQQALKDWETEKASRSLLGSYPPNKLAE